MKKLVIIGASGHGKVVADIAKKNGYTEIVFLDDNTEKTVCGQYSVVGQSTMASILGGDLFVAIGDATIRKRMMDSFGSCVTLIHPNAIIADDVKIGEGTVVMAGVVINPGVKIGRGCIINTSSSIDHDCVLNDFIHVSVGVHVSGTVSIGADSWIGAGTTVSNNIDICSNSIIGAGSVVVKDITDPGVYVGIPARMIKDKQG